MALSSNLRSRLVGAVISVGLFVVILPATLIVTFMLFPLRSWIEDTFNIESVGHSGPTLRRRHRHGLVMAKPRPWPSTTAADMPCTDPAR
ncbi:MAG TPA: hypothetical protein VJO12_12660 [Stellaceae bacterium]|nr:hypothetical protein [Stellaceae bacterium]